LSRLFESGMGFFSSQKRAIGAFLGTTALVCGCAGRPELPPQFVGTRGPMRVAPKAVQDLLLMPSGYEVLGEVSVRCNAYERSDGLFFLSTFGSCDLDALVSRLAVEVSRAGGEAMVGRRCDHDTDQSVGFDDKPVTSESITCKAVVARRVLANSSSGPIPPAPAVTTAPQRVAAPRPKPSPKVYRGNCSKLPCAL
jgi:hypothetical protein